VNAVRAIETHLRLEQSNKKLIKAQKSMATVFNTVPGGLITINERGIIANVNSTGASILELLPRDMIGKKLDDILSWNWKTRDILQTMDECIEEELVLDLSGCKVYCQVTASPIIDENGGKAGAVLALCKKQNTHQATRAIVHNHAKFTFDDIIGESSSILATIENAKRIAKGSSTVLILGESGTGKEIFAQAIHNASEYRRGPYITVNCGGIPRELIQSELFGYSEGAFTGAKKGGHKGKMELASGGSLFLDEIGDMPQEMQVNLLRALEDKVIVCIGGDKAIPVDVRIIAATNRDLYEDVKRGKFREDLYYRINVVSITIPPLRKRKGDVLLLAKCFIKTLSQKLGRRIDSIDSGVFSAIAAYHWPGNVRELINALEHAINMMPGKDLLIDHLPSSLNKNQPPDSRTADEEIVSLNTLEEVAIKRSLTLYHNNITKVATSLGIGRNTLYCKMKKYGIHA
jgi:transcriptional regulator with PAS, ATPase and Fis domain